MMKGGKVGKLLGGLAKAGLGLLGKKRVGRNASERVDHVFKNVTAKVGSKLRKLSALMKFGPFMSNVSSTMGSTLGKLAKVSSKFGKMGSFVTVGDLGTKVMSDLGKIGSVVGVDRIGGKLKNVSSSVGTNLTEFGSFMQSKNVSEKLGSKLDEMGFKKFGNRMRKVGHIMRKFKFGKKWEKGYSRIRWTA